MTGDRKKETGPQVTVAVSAALNGATGIVPADMEDGYKEVKGALVMRGYSNFVSDASEQEKNKQQENAGFDLPGPGAFSG